MLKSVVLHRVRVPFVEPFLISNGVVAEKDAILIELTTADGIVGWGEASPMSGSFYSADTPDTSWANTIAGTQRVLGIGVVVSTPVDDALIAATIATIKTHHPGPVVLGGVAIRDQDHAVALGGDIWTTSARDAVEHFDATT
jgi:hypothetical protein